MRCRNVAELASDYMDGQVSWRRQIAIRLHLAMCKICRRYVGQMRQTTDVLRRSGENDPPASGERARALFRTHQK